MISVKFSFWFRDKNNETVATIKNFKNFSKEDNSLKKIPPVIRGVIKGNESHKILKPQDLIVAINNKKIKNLYDFFREKSKLRWSSVVKFSIKRNRKIIEKEITLNSFENWKKKYPRLGIEVREEKNCIKVSNIDYLSSALPKFSSSNKVRFRDVIISLNNKKIKTLKKWDIEVGKLIPKKTALFKVQAFGGPKRLEKIRIINFNQFLELNREFCMDMWPKKAAEILLREYEENDFLLDPKRKSEVIKKYEDDKYKDKLIEGMGTLVEKGRAKITKKIKGKRRLIIKKGQQGI